MLSRSWRSTLFWLSLSFVPATCGFSIPRLTGSSASWYLSTWLALAWLAIVLAGLAILRWRGLVLLVGAPLALYYPAVAYSIISACAKNINMCP
jgi:hypothetical protein